MGVPPPTHGTAFRVIEFPPFDPQLESMSSAEVQRAWGMEHSARVGHPPRHPFIHRTRTIDYIVILEGEIDMLLDDGEVHLQSGDTLIQRGTNHAWINRGTKTCRVAIVFVDASEPQELA
ncbi:hypothetical protein WL00_11380 [Burkholderia cepacia]|nr:hypothetical protein WL00_11380 [Burkholderia cepacia]KVX72582.1 hypothetical protein WL07_13475 [Burkholderia cepacia]